MTRSTLCVGLLLASTAGAQGMLIPTETSLPPLGVKYQRVTAQVVDGAAVTKVEQVFVNRTNRPLEAHYVFPLPKGAALQDFYLWIDGKKTRGEVLEKKKATDIYEGIVRRLQDPGLLEYVDSDAFRARVFPVPPRGEQRIELSFSQVLDYSAGLYRYHYPLGASSRGAPRLSVEQDFTFSATIRSKTPLRSIYSPTHRLGVSRKGDGEAVVGLESGPGTDISKDLDLFYTVSEKAVGLTVLSSRPDPSEPGFFMALVAPRMETKADEVVAKRVTFVMDTSGSMAGERIKLARDTLRSCVGRLNSVDEFNVVRFSTDVEALFDTPQPATKANVDKALRFIADLEAIGGTALDEALTRALQDGEGRGQRPHMVLFVTDGQPTVGETEEAEITAHAQAANRGSRLFTFGVGDDLNARLLDRVAEVGHGTSDFVRDGRDFEVKVGSFFDQVANPVLTDVALDLAAFGAYDVYPKRLGDLFKGQQLVVLGRYRTPREGTVVLSGQVNGKKSVFEYRGEMVKSGAPYDFVPRLWAIRKVGYLLEAIRLHGEKAELTGEVVALGKKYGIVTPYTSYLVVEDTPPVQPAPITATTPQPRSTMSGIGRSRGDVDSEPRPPPAEARRVVEKKALESAGGSAGVAASKAVRAMKDEEQVEPSGEAVRVASGRTFLLRGGRWVDAGADAAPKQLAVRAFSDAWFALLKARPELKAALALSNRLVLVVAPGKRVVIEPDAGETKAQAVEAFLK